MLAFDARLVAFVSRELLSSSCLTFCRQISPRIAFDLRMADAAECPASSASVADASPFEAKDVHSTELYSLSGDNVVSSSSDLDACEVFEKLDGIQGE